jgi:hypothetical protein
MLCGGRSAGLFAWVWIDTCYINKSSSAELFGSHQLNVSMVQWMAKVSLQPRFWHFPEPNPPNLKLLKYVCYLDLTTYYKQQV